MSEEKGEETRGKTVGELQGDHAELENRLKHEDRAKVNFKATFAV